MSSREMLQSIQKGQRNVTKAQQLKDEMALVMGPHANWESYLVPAPMCIFLLGDLMLISTTKDFSLEKSTPIGGFKFLTNPGSFRACLAQISNSGYHAFQGAHANMDKIRLMSAEIPQKLTEISKIVVQGSDEDMVDLLPIPLNGIKETARKCEELSKQSYEDFKNVMSIVGELLVVCTDAKGKYETELREVQIGIKLAEEKKQAAEEEKAEATRIKIELQKNAKRAEEAYYKSLENMPKGFDMLGLQTCDAIQKTVTTSISGFVKLVTFSRFRGDSDEDHESTARATTVKRGQAVVSTPVDINVVKVYSLAPLIKTEIDKVVEQYTSDDTLKKEALQDDEPLIVCQKQLEGFLNGIEDLKKTKGYDKARKLCDTGKKFCDELRKHHGAYSDITDKEAKGLYLEMKKVQESAIAFQSESFVRLGANPTEGQAPRQSTCASNYAEEIPSGLVQQQIQNARFQIEQTASHLESTQNQYEKACDRMMNATEKMGKLMAELASLDLRSLNFKKIKEILARTISTLGTLSEEWSKLVKFFSMISNLIEVSMNVHLKDFTQGVDAVQRRREETSGYTITSAKRDFIYKHAFEAAKIGYLVNMISGAYVEISDRYLVSKIAGLGKLLAFDPEKDMGKVQQEVTKLRRDCDEAQQGIKELVLRKKDEFESSIHKRVEQVRGELEKALPPPTEQQAIEVKSAQEEMKKAVQEAAEDDDIEDQWG